MPRDSIQLGQLCRHLGVAPRDARYVLEQKFVPQGVEASPASGHHRSFDYRQAFWLAMVLKLKAIGVRVRLAALIADYAEKSLQTLTHHLAWDWKFSPRKGEFDTLHRYFVDVGDGEYIRLVSDADPSGGGQLRELDWQRILDSRRAAVEVRPSALIRLDLAQIARLLAQAFSEESAPSR